MLPVAFQALNAVCFCFFLFHGGIDSFVFTAIVPHESDLTKFLGFF